MRQALNAAGVEYLIGGAIAEWAWGEPRATQDVDLVVNIPIKSVNKLSKELEKRDMLIPAEIILDNILEDRADIPINAIHMHSGLQAICIRCGGSHSLQAHGLWTEPAIETFPRHRRDLKIKEKRAGYELYRAVGRSIRTEFAMEGNA